MWCWICYKDQTLMYCKSLKDPIPFSEKKNSFRFSENDTVNLCVFFLVFGGDKFFLFIRLCFDYANVMMLPMTTMTITVTVMMISSAEWLEFSSSNKLFARWLIWLCGIFFFFRISTIKEFSILWLFFFFSANYHLKKSTDFVE